MTLHEQMMNVTLITVLFVSLCGLTESQDQTYLLWWNDSDSFRGFGSNNNMYLVRSLVQLESKLTFALACPSCSVRFKYVWYFTDLDN